MTASSSSCLSSLRTSRSPTAGSRPETLSPSSLPVRGNISSSNPRRTTTRCGTERIGTMVHTVSSPVRKFARDGRPARACVSIARTSANRSSVSSPPLVASSSSRSACPRCHASASLVAVSRSSARTSASRHRVVVWGPCKSRTTTASRSRNSANRPVRSMSLPSTSSSGSARSSHSCSDSSAATPSNRRSSAKLKVFCANSPKPNRPRCRELIPHLAPES